MNVRSNLRSDSIELDFKEISYLVEFFNVDESYTSKLKLSPLKVFKHKIKDNIYAIKASQLSCVVEEAGSKTQNI